MIRIFIVAGVTVVCALGTVFAQEQTTIRGEVVGLSCFTNRQLANGAGTDAKASCSLSALQAGEPAGIVDEKSGKLYIAISDDGSNVNNKLLPNVAKLVDVTGKVQEREGVNTITVKEVRPVEGSSGQVQAGAPPEQNATGMPSGALSEPGTQNDTLYNVTRAPGIHNASPRELPGIPNRGTRMGEAYTEEEENPR